MGNKSNAGRKTKSTITAVVKMRAQNSPKLTFGTKLLTTNKPNPIDRISVVITSAGPV